jgi:hypothetical protein
VASGRVLYISDAINKDVYHQHLGFLQFDTDIRMVAPIGPNFFISDSRFIWFAEKMQSPIDLPAPMFRLRKIAHYPAAPGNPGISMEGVKTEINYYPDAVMWVSEQGICVGGVDGSFENLTEKKYEMPASIRSANVLKRSIGDVNLFISVLDG